MHRVIATVPAYQARDAALPEGTTTLEVRLDSAWPTVPDPDQATQDLDDLLGRFEAQAELLATLRPRSQGGAFEGDEAVRLGLLAAAARCGFRAVDVEATAAVPPVLAVMRDAGAAIVVSHHARAPPSREDGLTGLLRLQDLGADLEKLAFPAGSFADNLRALELARAHAERHGRPCIAPLGLQAAPMRALLAVAANQATYGHASGTRPGQAGQPALADIVATWRHWGIRQDDLAARGRPLRPMLAVLGTPVAHSLSPRMHNAALRAAGREERYVALDVPPSAAALRLALMVGPRFGLTGASVTAPHKADAARMAVADPLATATGAANCLRWRERWEATNTDASALRRLLARHLDAAAPCVILGAGGAARAAAWAARDLGAVVHFTSRDPARAEAFAKATGAKWTPWDRRGKLAGQAWVQATPSDPGIPATQLRGAPLCIELRYDPGGATTAFEQAAAEASCPLLDGRAVLLEQGVDAYRFWTGMDPDRAAMAAALQPPAETGASREAERWAS